MDGLILHFDAEQGNGLVRAGDGKRYPFDLSQWRSAHPPQSGDTVDFEIVNGQVSDLYVVRPISQPSAGPALATYPNQSAQPDILLYLGQRPGLVPASFIILSCFLPFISVPFFSVSLFGIVGYVSSALNMMSGFGGAVGLRLAMWSLYLLYAIPGSAGWLIYREIRGEASPGLRMKVGLTGLVGPFAIYFLSTLILVASTASNAGASQFAGSPMGVTPGMGGPGVLAILSFIGIGWMLLAAASIALIAVGRGWSPLAKREPAEAGMPLSDQPAFNVAPTATVANTAPEDAAVEDYESEAADRSAGRTRMLRNVTRGGEGAALFGFLLPWVTFVYSGQELGHASGFDLTIGRSIGSIPAGGSGLSVAAILALVLIGAALTLSFFWGGRRLAFAAIVACGGALASLLFEIFYRLQRAITVPESQTDGGFLGPYTHLVQQPVQANTAGGFWLVAIALSAAIIASWMILGDEDAPAD